MVRVSAVFLALAVGLLLTGCATRTLSGLERYNQVPSRFMGMSDLKAAAKGGRTVVRVITVDEGEFRPVIEYVAEPNGGPVTVTAVNVPGNFGAPTMTARVDPELWKLALEDFETLRRAAAKSARSGSVTLDAAQAAAVAKAGIDVKDVEFLCPTGSWFLVADRRGVSAPGFVDLDSCANKQEAAMPGLYGLALHSFAPCDELEPRALNAGGVSRCLRMLGVKAPAVELANLVWDERDALNGENDDLPVILAHFGADAQFIPQGGAPVAGPQALRAAWQAFSAGRQPWISLSTFEGLSPTEVEVRGEAFHLIERDPEGRALEGEARQMWTAPFRQVWIKSASGWTIREFGIEPWTRTFGVDVIARFLEDEPPKATRR